MQYKRKSRNQQLLTLGGKIIGSIVNGRLVKRVRQSRHLYRKIPGWSFSIDVLETLDDLDIQRIWVIDQETEKTYKAALSDFQRYGVFVNNGGDVQLCLPLDRWIIS
jgi:hypothetical protein